MKIQLDHVTCCGGELAAMQRTFAEAGLAAEYGGVHSNGVTHMALLGFEDGSYLELIAPLKLGEAGDSPWGLLMLGEAGAGAWAVATADIQAEVKRLRGLGIGATDPAMGRRRCPDGKMLEWQTASSGPGTAGALMPFVIQDRTPREWRAQPSASVKDIGVRGIAAVVLGVREIDTAGELFRRTYGWEVPAVEEHEDFGKTAHFTGTPVILAAPLQKDSWLAKRLETFGDCPAAFLLGTSQPRAAAERFKLSASEKWFGRDLAWFAGEKFRELKLGVIAAG